MSELIPSIASAIWGRLDLPFALFGHSLGAIIAFELARYLAREAGKTPAHLFVSGTTPPHIRRTGPIIHNLPEAEFVAELKRLDGTSQEILNNAEAMDLLMPILRADFELIETYEYQDGPRLTCPIRALGGLKDSEVLMQQLSEWKRYTSSSFSMSMMPGGHFFLATAETQLLSVLSSDLEWLAARQYSI